MTIKAISDIELTQLLDGFYRAQDHAVKEGLCSQDTADMIKQIGEATVETIQGLPKIGTAQAMVILKIAQDFGITLGGAVAFGNGDSDSAISKNYQLVVTPLLVQLMVHKIEHAAGARDAAEQASVSPNSATAH